MLKQLLQRIKFLKFNFIIFLLRRIFSVTRFRSLDLREKNIINRNGDNIFYILFILDFEVSSGRRKARKKIILQKNLTNY